MRIKQGRLTFEELQQLKWFAGIILTLISLWALCSLDIDAGLYLFIGIVAVCSALFFPRRIATIPEAVWRWTGPIMLVIVLVDFAFGFLNFFPPLMRMVVLLLLYRALAPRNRREDLQLLLLCLFSLVVSGALTVSLLFAVQILIFTPVAMSLLFIVCLLDRGPDSVTNSVNWDAFRWQHLLQRVWSVLDLRMLGGGTLLFAFVVGASTCFFVLIPRFNFEQAIPFLKLNTKPKTGFSDYVRLDSVSEITEDNGIALLVDVPSQAAIVSKPYWRILVLDQYRDGAFLLSPQMREFRKRERLRSLPGWTGWPVSFQDQKGELWTFYFEGGMSQYLPVPGAFQTMRFPSTQEMLLLPDLHVIGLDAVPQNRFSYQVEDLQFEVRSPASNAENQAFSTFSGVFDAGTQEMEVQYPLTTLQLSMGSQDREKLTELNHLLLGGDSDLSVVEYSQRVMRHLRGNFSYSLKPNGTDGGRDPVVSWLTQGSLGHCELFAGAFVLLARDAGYPARMVVGFVGGSWNSVENFFVVRNREAHAWVEIYDASMKEWLRVDPTPGGSSNNPEVVPPASFEVETGMRAWVDSLRMQWYRRIVSFDQTDQVELATTMIDLGDEMLEALSARLKEMRDSFRAWITQPFSRSSLVYGGSLIAVAFGLFILWRARYDWLVIIHRLLKRPQALSPVRREAARLLMKLEIVEAQKEVGQESDLRVRNGLHSVRGELEALRFGPEVPLVEAKQILTNAKRVLRRCFKY
jgi:hypothetical protein